MIFYLLWIPAALTTLAVFCIWTALSKWWILLLLPLAFILWNGLYLLYTWIICRRVDMDAEWTGISSFYQKNTLWFIDWLLALTGVRYELRGREWLPEGEFLLVGNHRSAFDPLTTHAALRDRPFAFISKPENIYKLYLGSAAWSAGYLAIDRENARNALQTINAMADRMKNHVCSYGIYPEGTRTKTGDLQEFHAGSFKAAQKAHVPVVIMAVENSEKVLKNFPFRRTKVILTILETIDADEVKATKTAALAEHTRALLLEYLGH
jgi:1-acyl-sn-glycerol-3-phosphate acyltransferase